MDAVPVLLAGLVVGVAPSSFPLISVATGLALGQGAARPCCIEARKRALISSSARLHDANEFGLPEFAHAIERFDRDRNLGDTSGVVA